MFTTALFSTHYFRMIVKTKDESNVLKPIVWKELKELDSFIQNITISSGGQQYGYKELCSKWGDDCYQNDIVQIDTLVDNFDAGKSKISYPAAFNPTTFEVHFTGFYLNGVELDKDQFNLKSAKTILLHYFLVSDGPPDMDKK